MVVSWVRLPDGLRDTHVVRSTLAVSVPVAGLLGWVGKPTVIVAYLAPDHSRSIR
jgi:hypothetical protein